MEPVRCWLVLHMPRGSCWSVGNGIPQTQQLTNAVFITGRLRHLKIAVLLNAAASRGGLALGVNRQKLRCSVD